MDLPPPGYHNSPGRGDSMPVHGLDQHHIKPTPGSDVLQCVTNLLDATKALTECLQLWSVGRTTDEQVSDVYVNVGTKFNIMVAAFANIGIDMSDLYSIPGDLRTRLEECLCEDASPAVLAEHMPDIKSTLYRLLTGLRGKQDVYWRVVGGGMGNRGSVGSPR